jgi:large subunit ribosomal protein L35
MPKMKTHKGTAKRFRVTGSGKLVRKQAGLSHFNAKKSGGRKRRLKGMIQVAKVDPARMKALLGHQAPEGSQHDES